MGLSLCKLYHARPPDGSGHCMEVGTMPYSWPQDTDFAQWELDVIDRNCRVCGRMMHVCDHRYRRFHTLEGPVELVCKLNHCPDRGCQGHTHTKSPELEITIAPPQVGNRVGCLLLDRSSQVLAALVDFPDPGRSSGRLPHPAFPRRPRQVCPTLPSHARRAAARPGGSAAAIPNRR